MRLLTKGVLSGTALAVAAWAMLGLQKPVHPPVKPLNNSERPNVATFTVHFGAAAKGTAISWSAGFADDDLIAINSPWIKSVAVLDGQRLGLVAVPSVSKAGAHVKIECWIHVNGTQVAHQPLTARAKGCLLSATVHL